MGQGPPRQREVRTARAETVVCAIVCWVDDADAAVNVVSVAAALADALECPLRLVHAVPAPVTVTLATPAYAYPGELHPRERSEAGERLLQRGSWRSATRQAFFGMPRLTTGWSSSGSGGGED